MSERLAVRVRDMVEKGVPNGFIRGKSSDRVALVEEGAKLLLRYSRQIEMLDQTLESPDLGPKARARRETNAGHLMGLRSRLRASLVNELGTPRPHTRQRLIRIIT